MVKNLFCVLMLFFPIAAHASWVVNPSAVARDELLQEIVDDIKQDGAVLGKETLDPRVLTAMREVPREEFLPRMMHKIAYDNRPLPIGFGQTISQPYLVAIMTDLLDIAPGANILEVGTGSGYQAAIAAKLAGQVSTIEIIPELATKSRKLLKKLNFSNVTVREGDGYYGWKERAPFDGIIVTAVSPHIPPPLLQQLKPGGRMIIPVGNPFLTQHLMLVLKDAQGKTKVRQLLPVRFVPLTGKH